MFLYKTAVVNNTKTTLTDKQMLKWADDNIAEMNKALATQNVSITYFAFRGMASYYRSHFNTFMFYKY